MDAYRGFVMFLMMAEVLRLAEVASRVPASAFWSFLAFHQTHAPWAGCSLHDLIQPSFSFLVGVALPFSIASREGARPVAGRDDAPRVLAGVPARGARDLPAVDRPRPHTFTFEDTLTQIGLGYGLLFLLGFRPTRDAWIAFGLILVGYWAAFALYPLPGPGFDWSAAGDTRRLAVQLPGLRGALEQEHQPGLGVRPLVPEPVPARRLVHVQRRRLRHAQFHPDARRR